MSKSDSPKRRSFKDYYLGAIFRPRRTFDVLMEDSRRLRFGFFAISISVVLYTFVYVFLSMGGSYDFPAARRAAHAGPCRPARRPPGTSCNTYSR